MSSPSALSKRREAEFQAEDDLRTLGHAGEIRGDSKRMAACRRVHKKQQRSLNKVGRSLGKGKR